MGYRDDFSLDMYLDDRRKQLIDLKSILIGIIDYIQFLRNNMNNPRTLKRQLRETIILKIDYLQYSMDKWLPGDQTRSELKKIGRIVDDSHSIQEYKKEIKTFLDKTIFYHFISGYGEKQGFTWQNDKMDGMVWLQTVLGEKYIVFKAAENEVARVMDIEGNVLQDYPETINRYYSDLLKRKRDWFPFEFIDELK